MFISLIFSLLFFLVLSCPLSWSTPALFIQTSFQIQNTLYAPPTAFSIQGSYWKKSVLFWKYIFQTLSESQWVLHDRKNVFWVLETFSLKKKSPSQVLRKWKKLFKKLDHRPPSHPQERQVWKYYHLIAQKQGGFSKLISRLRIQQGARERIQKGLIKSRIWIPMILKIFQKFHVPPEIALLPLLESGFSPHARSPASALGLWQWLVTSGARYLHISKTLDERLDPWRSTQAAAKELSKLNHFFHSWSLALLAYHHGKTRVQKAVQKTSSTQTEVVLKAYASLHYGFQTRNYYLKFLALLLIAKDFFSHSSFLSPLPTSSPTFSMTSSLTPPSISSSLASRPYSPQVPTPLLISSPTHFVEVGLAEAVLVPRLCQQLKLPCSLLFQLNPALSKQIRTGKTPLPRNYILRIPSSWGKSLGGAREAFWKLFLKMTQKKQTHIQTQEKEAS